MTCLGALGMCSGMTGERPGDGRAATRDYVAQGGKSAVGMHLAPRKRRPTLLWRGCCLPPRRMGLSNRERRMRTRPAFVNCDCPRRSLHRRCWCSRGTAQVAGVTRRRSPLFTSTPTKGGIYPLTK
eukprot:gene10803-biopygen16820